MKKFKFRLEKVLQYRQAIKNDCERELMLANGQLNAHLSRLEDLERAQIENRPPQELSADVNEFVMRGLYAQRLKEEIIKQRVVIVEAEKVVEAAKEKYIEAAKEAKALEMLKEKKSKAYAEYVEQEEGKYLDEMVTQRVSRLRIKQDNI